VIVTESWQNVAPAHLVGDVTALVVGLGPRTGGKPTTGTVTSTAGRVSYGRAMAVTGRLRPITQYGEPVLHAPCAEVTEFGPELEQLVADMFVTMAEADGAGLAANQVGVALRVFVVDCADGDGRRVVAHVVNPRLLPLGSDRVLDDREEGCLSVPGSYAALARPDRAVVEGVDQHGEPVQIEAVGGVLARCLQHETDHLEGRVFVERLSRKERTRVLTEAGFAAVRI
jgi:peptide deformylase